MKLVIEICMDHDAFARHPHHAVTSALSELKHKLMLDGKAESIKIRDVNGNTVGTAEVIADA